MGVNSATDTHKGGPRRGGTSLARKAYHRTAGKSSPGGEFPTAAGSRPGRSPARPARLGLDAAATMGERRRLGGRSHAACRSWLTFSALSNATPGARRAPRRGLRKQGGPAAKSSGGRSHSVRASRTPEPPAGAAGRGGAGENAARLGEPASPSSATHTEAAATRRSAAAAGRGEQNQAPAPGGGKAARSAARGPGRSREGPKPRRGRKRDPRGPTRCRRDKAKRSKGDRSGSPQRSEAGPKGRRGQRAPAEAAGEAEAAQEAERGSGGEAQRGRAGGRAAPERARAAKRPGSTRSGQKARATAKPTRRDEREPGQARTPRAEARGLRGPGASGPGGPREWARAPGRSPPAFDGPQAFT